MTSGNTKYKKLVLYQHQGHDIIIDSFRAREWSDFMIVTFDHPQLTNEVYTQISEVFAEASKNTNKQLIFIHQDIADSIEFYGVEVDGTESIPDTK